MQPPRSTHFDDVYFSAQDGMAETNHVFMAGNNLPVRWQGRNHFTVAETGFGTGLNFLTCWKHFMETAPPGATLDFISVEKFPLTAGDIKTYLAPWESVIGSYTDKLCTQYPLRTAGYHRIVFDNRIFLTLIFDDVKDALPSLSASVDAWFLDGFTPAKNPDMWTANLFSDMARLSAPNATFSTFTAAGGVKRGLQEAGFTVQKAKGFGHKRDMLCGHMPGKDIVVMRPPKTIAIIGGGLAGTACAYVLKQYGFAPVIYERAAALAPGASGNIRGLYNPRFTALRGAESDFYASAFAQMRRTLGCMDDVDFTTIGALHLITDDDKQKRFTRTAENWGWHADHMRVVDAGIASDIAGVQINHAGLYLPDSGFAAPEKLCRAYAYGVETRLLSDIRSLDDIDADVIILCAGADVMDFCPGLPVHTVRGQITLAAENEASRCLKTNLCYSGYVSAPQGGYHVVGSTFQKWLSHTDVLVEDDADNLFKLRAVVPALGDLKITGARAALRCSSSDRFPVIGHVRDNIYVSTAHGSHGMVSTLMGVHLLADILRGGPLCLPQKTVSALSPARFAARKARHLS